MESEASTHPSALPERFGLCSISPRVASIKTVWSSGNNGVVTSSLGHYLLRRNRRGYTREACAVRRLKGPVDDGHSPVSLRNSGTVLRRRPG